MRQERRVECSLKTQKSRLKAMVERVCAEGGVCAGDRGVDQGRNQDVNT